MTSQAYQEQDLGIDELSHPTNKGTRGAWKDPMVKLPCTLLPELLFEPVEL